MPEPFDLVPVASPLHDAAALQRFTAAYRDALAGLGGRPAAAAPTDAPLAVLVTTGGTEHAILELWQRQQGAWPGEPLVLVATPDSNSLPACLEALARVQQDDGAGRIVYFPTPADAAAAAELGALMEVLRVRRQLHRTRIGLVGDPSDWLVASSPTAEVVRRSWGPEVVPVAIGRAVDGYRAAPEPVVLQLARSVSTGASAFGETDERTVAAAARLHPALRRLVDEDRLDAVAVRCFDLLTSVQTSGCVALAELNDEGIVAGCEGDVVSTVAMLWVHALTGGAAWMANPARVDPASGLVRLAHCTIARSLTSGYALRSHFESGIGVGIAAQVPPGPVTLVRIGGAGLDRLFLAEGEAAPAGPDEALCRTQVDVTVGPDAVADLLAQPLGNHIVVVPGRHAAWLRRYHDLAVRSGR